MPHSSTDSLWSQIEIKIRDNLEKYELMRKYCAHCGVHEIETNEENEKCSIILGRCYGCQMVYYCSQEHQHLDWLENHMPKCAELEWVSLCELVQSIPLSLTLTNAGMLWPNDSNINTWTDWFDIRPDLVESIRLLAESIETELFLTNDKNLLITNKNKFNRREPTLNDLIDGLLAKITHSMTYSLTIGNALLKLNLFNEPRPICVHILYPTNDLIEDLVYLFMSNLNDNEIKLERSEIDIVMKKKFYELLNMFDSASSIEIVFISTNPIVDSSCFNYMYSNDDLRLNKPVLIDWSKLLPTPLMKKDVKMLINKKNLYISAWQGSYSNYIKYACNNDDGYLEPDLVVSFHPNFTKSPHKLITDWTDDLKVILTNNLPCLFTFNDRLEKEKAYQILNAFQTNFLCVQSNQFSSLLLKQCELKPNRVYSTNGFYMLLKGFKNDCLNVSNSNNDTIANKNENMRSIRLLANEQKQITGPETIKRSKSIHDLFSNQPFFRLNTNITTTTTNNNNNLNIQNDACVQTMGLDEPENPSLRHKNGKLQINKTKQSQQQQQQQQQQYRDIHKSNPNMLNMIDILIDEDTSRTYEKANPIHQPPPLIQNYQIPSLDYSSTLNNTLYRPSNFIKSHQPHLAIITQIDHDLKLNYSSRLKISPKPEPNTRYYQPRLLKRPINTNQNDQQQQHNQITELLMIKKEEQTNNESTFFTSSSTTCIIQSQNGIDVYKHQQDYESLVKNNNNDCDEQSQTVPIVQTRTNKSSITSSNQTTCQSFDDKELVDSPSKQTNEIPNAKPRVLNNIDKSTDLLDECKKIPYTKPRSNYCNLISDDVSSSSSASLKEFDSLKKLDETPKPRLKKFNLNQSQNPLPKPRYIVNKTSDSTSENESDENLKLNINSAIINPNQTSLTNNSNIQTNLKQATESSLKKEIELLSTTSPTSSSSNISSSSNLSASSSTRSSTQISSPRETISSSSSSFTNCLINNQGFVSQMKNIFESSHKNLNIQKNFELKKPIKKLINNNDAQTKLCETTTTESNVQNVEREQDIYMNVSNKYLQFHKMKKDQELSNKPVLLPPPPQCPPPPPPPPPLPPLPISPPPDQTSSPTKQKTTTTENLVTEILKSNPSPTKNQTCLENKQNYSDDNNNQCQLSKEQQKQRLMSNTSSCTNYTLRSDFRILNTANLNNQSERSLTLSSNSLLTNNNNNNLMIHHLSDAVDEVKLQYEGQRHVIVPGYMTSADILRNILLNSNNCNNTSTNSNSIQTNEIIKNSIPMTKQNDNLTLKEKLLLQKHQPVQQQHLKQQHQPVQQQQYQPVQQQQCQPVQQQQCQPVQNENPVYLPKNQTNFDTNEFRNETVVNKIIKNDVKDDDEDEFLAKKFSQRNRTRSMSGVITLDLTNTQTTQIIDIDLDYESNDQIVQVEQVNVIDEEKILTTKQLAEQAISDNNIPLKPPRVFESVKQSLTNTYEKNFNQKEETTQQIQTNRFDSIRSSSINGSRRILPNLTQKMTVTGSFDPNDFDSFDEEEYIQEQNYNEQNYDETRNEENKFNLNDDLLFHPIPLESIEKIREDGIMQQKIENDIKIQEMNLVQFDPDDFDSFDEDDFNSTQNEQKNHQFIEQIKLEKPAHILPKINLKNENDLSQTKSQETTLINNNNNNESITSNSNHGFLRSALDRLSTRSNKSKSSKTARSSSVPMRTLLNTQLKLDNEQEKKEQKQIQITNQKTLNLMNKMQLEHEEKQKRKQKRREQKLVEERKRLAQSATSIQTPDKERKFLTSIINTIFSSNNQQKDEQQQQHEHQQQLNKNESKRLSLRRLKAKDKAKKYETSSKIDHDDDDVNYDTKSEILNYQSDSDFKKSNRSLNLEMSCSSDEDEKNVKNMNIKLNLLKQARLNGKIKNEYLNDKKDSLNSRNKKEDLMKQLKAELDEEIKDRKMIEIKNNIINGNNVETTNTFCNRKSLRSSSKRDTNQNRQIRSKSVTFLDELNNTENEEYEERLVDDYNDNDNDDDVDDESNQMLMTPSSSRKNIASLRSGDARLFAGALTGSGPIRSIMKKSSNDLVELSSELPKISLNHKNNDLNELILNHSSKTAMSKSQTTPNLRQRREQVLQSDL